MGRRGTEVRERAWTIGVRVTQAEYAQIRERAGAANRTISSFVRDSALGKSVSVTGGERLSTAVWMAAQRLLAAYPDASDAFEELMSVAREAQGYAAGVDL